MPTTCTDADFDELSWHDCSIWGVALQSGGGDPTFEHANLALDTSSNSSLDGRYYGTDR